MNHNDLLQMVKELSVTPLTPPVRVFSYRLSPTEVVPLFAISAVGEMAWLAMPKPGDERIAVVNFNKPDGGVPGPTPNDALVAVQCFADGSLRWGIVYLADVKRQDADMFAAVQERITAIQDGAQADSFDGRVTEGNFRIFSLSLPNKTSMN